MAVTDISRENDYIAITRHAGERNGFESSNLGVEAYYARAATWSKIETGGLFNVKPQSVAEAWRYAFRLLASASGAQNLEWTGPQDPAQLRIRVTTLAVLTNVVPGSQVGKMDLVTEKWAQQFDGRSDVALNELRAAAHRFLRQTVRGDSGLRMESENLRMLFDVEAPSRDQQQMTPAIREACLKQCEEWNRRLTTDDEWTTLPGVIPGTASVPLKDVFVDVQAAARSRMDFCEQPPEFESSRRWRTGHDGTNARITTAAMVSRTLEACVVVGEPGSGKSTLVQWIAWSIAHQQFRDFDLALVVRLRQYATKVEQHPNTSIVAAFLQRLGTPADESEAMADCLRDASRRSHRVLLLLDGWDEVPVDQQAAVQAKIAREFRDFVVLITSRMSGMPWQLLQNDAGEVYEIAGLALPSIQKFVTKQLMARGRQSQAASVIDRIVKDRDLHELAANPFLLGLLVGVLSLPTRRHEAITRADLCQQIVDWMVASQRQKSPLQGQHLRSLQRLAFDLLFGDDGARYVFRRGELERAVGTGDATAVIQSRFIDQIDPFEEGWAFMHATLEEFFAAVHLDESRDLGTNFNWDRAFWSPRQFPVLEFLAGLMGKATGQLRERAGGWLAGPDRFGVVLGRLVRMSVAGQWSRTIPEFVALLLNRLWRAITNPQDLGFRKRMIQYFAWQATGELLQRAATLKSNAGPIWELICEVVPKEDIRLSPLFGALPDSLKEHVQSVEMSEAPPAAVARVVDNLSTASATPKQQMEAFDAAARFRTPEVAERLLDRLMSLPEGRLRDYGTLAVSRVFNAVPLNRMTELLSRGDAIPPIVRRLASERLSHGPGQGAELDPENREQILRQLACLPWHDSRVEPMLSALRGFPIRDGGELIAEIARSLELDPAVRDMAIRVLHTVADRNVVALSVSAVETEDSKLLFPVWLSLAASRNIRLNRTWLEERVLCETNSLIRRTLLTIYFQRFEDLDTGGAVAWAEFLEHYIRRRLAAC